MIKYNFNDFPSDIFILCETIGATLTIGKSLLIMYQVFY